MDDWKERLIQKLEPVLSEPDPRSQMGVYHDLPFAIFVYEPESEFALREEVALLGRRLENKAKRVTVVSLADCLEKALAANVSSAELFESEATVGLSETLRMAHAVLTDYTPLDDLVVASLPQPVDPIRDIVFLVRAGALFPFYRTSALLERLKGRVQVPLVLFYPGAREGASGLRFMKTLDPDHAYRIRVF